MCSLVAWLTCDLCSETCGFLEALALRAGGGGGIPDLAKFAASPSSHARHMRPHDMD